MQEKLSLMEILSKKSFLILNCEFYYKGALQYFSKCQSVNVHTGGSYPAVYNFVRFVVFFVIFLLIVLFFGSATKKEH